MNQTKIAMVFDIDVKIVSLIANGSVVSFG